MGLFKSKTPAQITDSRGHVWEPAPTPNRNGERVYYDTSLPDDQGDYMLTPSEIKAER